MVFAAIIVLLVTVALSYVLLALQAIGHSARTRQAEQAVRDLEQQTIRAMIDAARQAGQFRG